MKYTTEIIINKSREEILKKLDNVENMKHWQHGLVSAEHISGTPKEFGAKLKLNYQFGKRKMELVETITKRNFPIEFHATYNTKGIHNIQENFFEATNDKQTKWTSKNEFLPTNFMMRMMTIIMPNTFKKQSLKYMIDFKNFVENETSVTNG
jgi:carbon monoxide dehydrogenase subunit G